MLVANIYSYHCMVRCSRVNTEDARQEERRYQVVCLAHRRLSSSDPQPHPNKLHRFRAATPVPMGSAINRHQCAAYYAPFSEIPGRYS